MVFSSYLIDINGSYYVDFSIYRNKMLFFRSVSEEKLADFLLIAHGTYNWDNTFLKNRILCKKKCRLMELYESVYKSYVSTPREGLISTNSCNNKLTPSIFLMLFFCTWGIIRTIINWASFSISLAM